MHPQRSPAVSDRHSVPPGRDPRQPPGLGDSGRTAFGAAPVANHSAVLDGGALPWDRLGWAAVGGTVAAMAGLAFVAHMLQVFRRRGFVTRFS